MTTHQAQQQDGTAAGAAELHRVLVIEDDPRQRRMLRTVLESNGYEVTTVGAVADAIEELARGPVALVIADMRLPGSPGSEIVDHVRGTPELKQVPILLVSAYGRPRSHRADAFLAKPFEIEHFERVVRRLAG
jgi:CheY-like chemotaxis protein